MTDHTFEGVDRDVYQRARTHWRPVTGVDTVGGDGLVDFRDPGPSRLGSSDDEEPEHDTIILAW